MDVADSDGDDVVLITIQDPDEDSHRFSGFSIDDTYRSRYPTSTGEFPLSIWGSLKIRVNGGIPLVSNALQEVKDSSLLENFDLAQSFTTGASAGRFRLTSVELLLGGTASTNLAAPRVRVVSGPPHESVGIELSGPASLNSRTPELYRFTPPGQHNTQSVNHVLDSR